MNLRYDLPFVSMVDFGEELIGSLTRRLPSSTVTHVAKVPSSPARYAAWPTWVEPSLKQLLVDAHLTSPYLHLSLIHISEPTRRS